MAGLGTGPGEDTGGTSGASGAGTSGVSGYSGKSGFSGVSGFSGKSGFSGGAGSAGTSGTSGASGTSGVSGTAASPNITTPMILATPSINLNEGTVAKQTLYTCPGTYNGSVVGGCVITGLIMAKFSGTADTAIVRIGWNVTANDIITELDFGSVGTGTGDFVLTPSSNIPFNAIPPLGLPTGVLGLQVTTPQGSALTARVSPIGYFLDAGGVPISSIVGVAP